MINYGRMRFVNWQIMFAKNVTPTSIMGIISMNMDVINMCAGITSNIKKAIQNYDTILKMACAFVINAIKKFTHKNKK